MLLSLLIGAAFATSSGISGVSTTGCGDCHGLTASSSTTAMFSTPETTVAPGDTITVMFTVSSSASTAKAGGLDVSATGGTLAAGSNTQRMRGEITHKSATAMTGGAVVFNFTWTAPTTEGTYTLRGAGNAVNHNGSDSGDGWNLASSLSLLVDDGCDDLDGDGVTDCDGDCDDTNATVYPGADELCDGLDNNCDGDIDESGAIDEPLWYGDSDGDGFGDPDVNTRSCSAPDGYIADGTDCDDSDPAISPAGTEIPYDGVDQDCSGLDLTDVDGDGYEAEVVGGDDCDDGNAAIYPGAPDTAGDGIDADCDGADTARADADGDGYDAIASGGTDCDDTDPRVYPGAPEVRYDGVDQDCDGSDLTDVDGDGYDAEVVGGDDCDDTHATTYPGAEDSVGDGVDENCDGVDGIASGDDTGDTGDTGAADSGDSGDTADTGESGDSTDSGDTADSVDSADSVETGETAAGDSTDSGDTVDTGDGADSDTISGQDTSAPAKATGCGCAAAGDADAGLWCVAVALVVGCRRSYRHAGVHAGVGASLLTLYGHTFGAVDHIWRTRR